ncbi:hypothetical protein [Nocardia thraciensis]
MQSDTPRFTTRLTSGDALTPLHLEILRELAAHRGARGAAEIARRIDRPAELVEHALNWLEARDYAQPDTAWQLTRTGMTVLERDGKGFTGSQLRTLRDLLRAGWPRTTDDLVYRSGRTRTSITITTRWLADHGYLHRTTAWRSTSKTPSALEASTEQRER